LTSFILLYIMNSSGGAYENRTRPADVQHLRTPR